MTLLLACAVCFQVEQSAATDGVQAAVLVLVGVTAVVLAGFGAFVGKIVRGAPPPRPPDADD